MKQKLPQFDAKQLCKALVKLGFEDCHGSNHQHQYKHKTKKSRGRRPYFLFPDNIGKKKEFQKALVRDLVRLWDIPLEDILKALK